MKDEKEFYRAFARQRYGQPWLVTKAEEARMSILSRLFPSGSRVLDVGCYDGTITNRLQEKNNRAFGIDVSLAALKVARAKGILCAASDISQPFPFKESTFDVVVAGEVIEHVLDLSGFMKEIKRVLKENGGLVLSTPNLASLGRRISLFFGKDPIIEIEAEGGAAGHIRYFVKDTLVKLLHKYGFVIEEFCSDVVNFDNSGKHFSRLLARLMPGFGKSLIIKAKNIK